MPFELIDSHCHLDFDGLRERLPELIQRMGAAEVVEALCVAVRLEDWPGVCAIAEAHPNIWASVGVHPDYAECLEPTVETLVELARHPKVLAIGETGLDYFRLSGDLEWQRERFRVHIRAARQARKPLIVHTRAAADDTLRILREEEAGEVGGVMHCFTESMAVAEQALDIGFHISFSGIVSFKNAADLREIARCTPLDRILVETDSPYLAPAPFRGKTNEPAFVRQVAQAVADARGVSLADIALATTRNYRRLFHSIH
jgi:TatD DNase family protein